MKFLRKFSLVLCFFVLGNSLSRAAVEFPNPGYERFEVPIFWKETKKKKSMANAKSRGLPFLPMKKPVRELQRDEIFELELPDSPKSGELYVSIEYNAELGSLREENPIIQIYGATFSCTVVETPDDPRFASKTSFYAFHESEDPNEGYWVKGSTRSYMKSPPKTTSSGRPLPASVVERLKSTQRIQLKIDFDNGSWAFHPSRDGAFPLAGDLDRPRLFLAKNETDPINISRIVFSEQPASRMVRRVANSSSRGRPTSLEGLSREERIERAKGAMEKRLETN